MGEFRPTIKLEHADSRGEIYSIALPGDKELMLLHSKAGSLRGGHAHDVSEVVVLLTGVMRYHKVGAGGFEKYQALHGGDASFNQAGEFHMGEFVEDTWLIEYKIGAGKETWRKDVDYEPYRSKVRANSAQ